MQTIQAGHLAFLTMMLLPSASALSAVTYQVTGGIQSAVSAPAQSGVAVSAQVAGTVAFNLTGTGPTLEIIPAAVNLTTISGTKTVTFAGVPTVTNLAGEIVSLGGQTLVFGTDPHSNGLGYAFYYGTGLALSASYAQGAGGYYSTMYSDFPSPAVFFRGFNLQSGGEPGLAAGTATFRVNFEWLAEGDPLLRGDGSAYLNFTPVPEPAAVPTLLALCALCPRNRTRKPVTAARTEAARSASSQQPIEERLVST